MRTKTIIHAFEPDTPLALPVSLIQRFFIGMGMAVVALFVLWATMGTMAQPAPSHLEREWQRYESDGFAFSYPPDWSVDALPEGGFRLTPVGRSGGTHIAVAYIAGAVTDLEHVERLGVAHIEQQAAVARYFLRILPRTRLADRAVAQVRYTADLRSGERVEGVWVGIPQANGRVLTFELSAYPDTYFNGINHTFNRLLASVTVKG